MYRRVQGKLDRIMRLVHEKLTRVRVIRAFNREEKKFSRLEKIPKRWIKRSKRWVASQGHESYYVCDCEVALIVILYGGAIKVDTGTLTKGSHCFNKLHVSNSSKSS